MEPDPGQWLPQAIKALHSRVPEVLSQDSSDPEEPSGDLRRHCYGESDGPYPRLRATTAELKGTVYTDASGIYPRCSRRRRVGFAATTLKANSDIDTSVKAPLVYPRQTVPAGELTGSMIVLKYSVQAVNATRWRGEETEIGDQVFDCSLIQKGLKRGRAWCTNAARPLADIWEKWWTYYEQSGA